MAASLIRMSSCMATECCFGRNRRFTSFETGSWTVEVDAKWTRPRQGTRCLSRHRGQRPRPVAMLRVVVRAANLQGTTREFKYSSKIV